MAQERERNWAGLVRGLALALSVAGCEDQVRPRSPLVTADAERGRTAAVRYGCGNCHTIPGVPGAHGLTAPPLLTIAEQAYVAEELPNTPENLVRWIMNPRDIDPSTEMPTLGVRESDARDLAKYLYQIRWSPP